MFYEDSMLAHIECWIVEAAKEREGLELAGMLEECGDPYEEISRALISGIDMLNALRHHRHEWDSNDYCRICGADGRA